MNPNTTDWSNLAQVILMVDTEGVRDQAYEHGIEYIIEHRHSDHVLGDHELGDPELCGFAQLSACWQVAFCLGRLGVNDEQTAATLLRLMHQDDVIREGVPDVEVLDVIKDGYQFGKTTCWMNADEIFAAFQLYQF